MSVLCQFYVSSMAALALGQFHVSSMFSVVMPHIASPPSGWTYAEGAGNRPSAGRNPPPNKGNPGTTYLWHATPTERKHANRSRDRQSAALVVLFQE